MWQATRKAAELIKLVTYCSNMNAYCANLPPLRLATCFVVLLMRK